MDLQWVYVGIIVVAAIAGLSGWTLRDVIGGLLSRVRSWSRQRSAARLASEASVHYEMDKYWVRGPGEESYRAFVVDVVDLLREVKSITDAGGAADPLKLDEWHQPKVISAGEAMSKALTEELLVVSKNAESAVLTEKGRQLLDTIDGARSKGLVP
jgi:hypothetical protein